MRRYKTLNGYLKGESLHRTLPGINRLDEDDAVEEADREIGREIEKETKEMNEEEQLEIRRRCWLEHMEEIRNGGAGDLVKLRMICDLLQEEILSVDHQMKRCVYMPIRGRAIPKYN